MAASHSNGPISVRVASRVLTLSASPFQPFHTPRYPFRSPRTPIGRCTAHLLPKFSRFCWKQAERGRARQMLRTVRDDVTGRGAALQGREEARPVAAYKKVAVRARPAQCGRASGAGGASATVWRWASEAAGSGAGPPGPRQGRISSSWAPRPGRRPGERRKGAGGTRPRPAAVMVSSAARPGRGGGAPPP